MKITHRKISLIADIKIQARLFLMQMRKNFSALAMISVVLPALVLGVVGISLIQTLDNSPNTSETLVSESGFNRADIREVRTQKYRKLAGQRVQTKKTSKYIQYAQLRSSQARKKPL